MVPFSPNEAPPMAVGLGARHTGTSQGEHAPLQLLQEQGARGAGAPGSVPVSHARCGYSARAVQHHLIGLFWSAQPTHHAFAIIREQIIAAQKIKNFFEETTR